MDQLAKVVAEEVVVEEAAEVVVVLLSSLSTVGHMVFVCMLVLIAVHQQQDIKLQQLLTTAWVEAIAIAQLQPDGVGAKIQH